jgi:hypothetical protein
MGGAVVLDRRGRQMRKQLDAGPARLRPSPPERTLDRRGFLELSLKRGTAGACLLAPSTTEKASAKASLYA